MGLCGVAERQTRAAAGAADAPVELSPTLEPAHYVVGWAQHEVAPIEASEAERAAHPSVLAVTEWPAERTKAEALGTAAGACDFLVFVVDPSDEESMSFFSDHVQLVHDGVPVAVVASKRPHPRNSDQQSSEALKELCSRGMLDVEVFPFAPKVSTS